MPGDDTSPPTGVHRVLLVEDNPSDARLVSAGLKLIRPDIDIVHCQTLAEALTVLSKDRFDVVLTDLNLPDSHSCATVAALTAALIHVPVIALTVDHDSGVDCIRAGAQDFVPKSDLDPHRLLRLAEFALARANQTKQVEFASRHDDLTGLLNRRAFEESVTVKLAQSAKDSTFYLCFIDVDDFKLVNDTYGHAAGDIVLQHVARQLRDHTDPLDLVARIGGDEFAAFGLIGSAVSKPSLETWVNANTVHVSLGDSHSPTPVVVSLSIGVVTAASGATYDDLVVRADERMYDHKRQARNRVPTPRTGTEHHVGDPNAKYSAR